MNTIVILCGGIKCGKTTTLKGFFKVKSVPSPKSYIEWKLDNKIVCAVYFGSPQEQEPFCNVEQVNENIKNRIAKCEDNTKDESYIVLIPFTMCGNRKGEKINRNCILEPIRKLEEKFQVFIIYLRKTNIRNLTEKDALMAQVASLTIQTTKQDYDKSVELEKFLREVVMKSN